MIYRYFKIWLKVVINNFDIKLTLIALFVEVLLFVFVYFFLMYNLALIFIIWYLLSIIFQIVQVFLFYKKLLYEQKYDLLLLKPVDPLYGLLVYRHNIADIFVMPLVLLYIKLSNFKK